MNYEDTWFGKQHITHRSCGMYDRTYWMYQYVNVFDGGFNPMHNVNKDGSIDILGVGINRIANGLSFGGELKAQQRSLAEHAEKLEAIGAKIVKQTKNRLVARYKNEEAVYVISPLTSNTFYKHEWED